MKKANSVEIGTEVHNMNLQKGMRKRLTNLEKELNSLQGGSKQQTIENLYVWDIEADSWIQRGCEIKHGSLNIYLDSSPETRDLDPLSSLDIKNHVVVIDDDM